MKKYKVVYDFICSDMNMRIQQEMTQLDLANLLTDKKVNLISVNDSGQIHHRKKRKERR